MTTFLRMLDVETSEKAKTLANAVASWRSGADPAGIFEVEPNNFEQVPGAPFAYWVGEDIRGLFSRCTQLEDGGRDAQSGVSTMDDFRHVRARWEVPSETIAQDRSATLGRRRWVALSKGGAYSQYYYDLDLVVDWNRDGRAMKAAVAAYRGSRGWGYNWSAAINGHGFYFRNGVTWPRRSQTGLSVRALGAGAIFGDKGPTVFATDEAELAYLLGLMNSLPFRRLVELQMAFGSYEVGVIERTPIPRFDGEGAREIEGLARDAWHNRRQSDSTRHVASTFSMPALLKTAGATLSTRSIAWEAELGDLDSLLFKIQQRIDDRAFHLYGIGVVDRRLMEVGFGSLLGGAEDSLVEEADSDEVLAGEGAELLTLVESLLEWALGVALGRFDIRLATGERNPAPDPEPFDLLPICGPGVLKGDDGLPAHEPPAGYPLDLPPHAILVDDPGHRWDVVARIEAVFGLIAGDRAHAWIHEAEGFLGRDLRDWLRRYGFERHLKRYSRSRRKAPLFWHLAPKSRDYGIWLYSPVATRDTFYRIQNDYIEPKLKAAERRLLELRQHAGASPTGQQRKGLTRQESLVEELRAFREQVARIAPLWKPFRDDGVVLNCAVLSPLFDHHRAWQKECARKWGELADAKYDWAGWAMHLWPERVVAACASDRSIAIAHGLEESLWEQDDDGKWEPRADVDEQIAALATERRSPALQAALDAYERVG